MPRQRIKRFPTVSSSETSTETTSTSEATTTTTSTTYAAGAVKLGKFGKITWLPFESLIGLLMIVTGCRDLFDEQRRAIPGVDSYVANFVSCVYIVGGTVILIGLWRAWLRVEMFGLFCLVVGITASTGLTLVHFDRDVFVDLITFLGAVFAASVRLHQLWNHHFMIQVKVNGEHNGGNNSG